MYDGLLSFRCIRHAHMYTAAQVYYRLNRTSLTRTALQQSVAVASVKHSCIRAAGVAATNSSVTCVSSAVTVTKVSVLAH